MKVKYELKEEEANNWNKLDYELRYLIVKQQLLILKSKIDEISFIHTSSNYHNLQYRRQEKIKRINLKIEKLKNQYKIYTEKLAKIYEIDITKIVIDPENRSIGEE